jgi:hypothetical protein
MPKSYIDHLINENTETNMRRRNKNIQENTEQYGGNRGNDISLTLFRFKNQIHIYHWQTTSFARHKAADEINDALVDFIDKFMEMYMGKYGRPNYASPSNIVVQNMNDAEAITFLDEMRNYFIEELPKLLDPKLDTDLLNIRDEILGSLNKVRYLYTLN